MVEALEQNVSAAATAHQDDEDLLSGVVAAPSKKAASNPAAGLDDNSYEETQMNPDGFFNECNDQVSLLVDDLIFSSFKRPECVRESHRIDREEVPKEYQ